MVCEDRTLFDWDITIWKPEILGYKKHLNIENISFKVVKIKFLAVHMFWYIYSRKFTEFIHGTRSLLNTLLA